MAKSSKDTIYIDLDDEITSIIEKVQDSDGKVVALVLPKRSTVFQSIVNLKLLKRTAAEAKKHIVLITSEAGLLPMAGAVGLHVAKTLQSKPVIPDAPEVVDRPVSVDDAAGVGAASLAGAAVATSTRPGGESAKTPDVSADEETIEVGDDVTSGPTKKDSENPNKETKRFKIPNFNKFRLRLFIGIALFVVLAVGWVYAYFILPEVTVTIKTNNVTVSSSITINASTEANEADLEQLIVPAKAEQFKVTETQKAAATGEKDVGERAKGAVSFTLQGCDQDKVTIPEGTQITSSNLTFLTNSSIVLLSTVKGGECKNDEDATGTVFVVAQNAGDQYNLSPREYTVSGFPGVSATGEAMSGGTSKIITVVSQSDIDAIRDKIISELGGTGRQAIEGQLQAGGFIPIPETIKRSDPIVTATPNAGEESAEVSVTVSLTYTMTGAQHDAVKQALESDILSQIDPNTQNILDNGLDTALIKLTNSLPDGVLVVSVRASALAGVAQDVDSIKASVAGKKGGEIQNILSNTPGVEEVTVDFNPAWVFKAPSSTDKITVIFQENDGSTTGGE